MKKTYKCPNCKSEKLVGRDFIVPSPSITNNGAEISSTILTPYVPIYFDYSDQQMKWDCCADCGTVYAYEVKV